MKKIILICAGLMLFYGIAGADFDGFGFSLGYGVGKKNIDIYRLGLKKDYASRWFESKAGFLSGFFELSYNRWEHGGDEVNGLSLSPVFAYYFGTDADFVRPYIAGGIGAALIDDYHIHNRNLGTHFQFEDRIGVGARIGIFDMNVSYFHSSNAGLKSPNDGLDTWLFTGAIQF
jgi:lipid A 3-O-deacylase